MKIKPRDYKIKMSEEEVQEHLKLKRGNGFHRNKKAYNRKEKHKAV